MSAYIREHGHKERLAKKHERVDGLKDLRQTHEDVPSPDWIYIAQLTERIERAEKQLAHMRP